MNRPRALLCLLLILALVGCLAYSSASSPSVNELSAAPHRCVYILRDVSNSYKKQLEQAQPRIAEIISTCGPADDVALLDAGLAFQPRTAVHIQGSLPSIPASLVQPTTNLNEYKRRQKELDMRWAQVDAGIAAIIRFVALPVKTERTETDLFGALEYISHRVEASACDEVYLFLFTDLIHEFKGEASDMPPRRALAFDRLRVEAFFVPWKNAATWKTKEDAWRQWFVQGGHAMRFAMLDEAASRIRSPLTRNRTPRKVPSPLRN
jgi:hypothetical protein